MFYQVRIMDGKGKLKKVLTNKMLAHRHWKLFPDYLKTNPQGKSDFNAYGKGKSGYDQDVFGFER
jgi:hypothetical protein